MLFSLEKKNRSLRRDVGEKYKITQGIEKLGTENVKSLSDNTKTQCVYV